MQVHDRLDDRQAEAHPFGAAGAVGVDLVEAVEQPGQVLGGDATAGIADAQRAGAGSIGFRRQGDGAAGWRVVQGIRQQVRQRPVQQLRLGMHGPAASIRNGNPLLLGHGVEEIPRLLKHVERIKRLSAEFLLRTLGPRQKEKVVHHNGKAPQFLQIVSQPFLIFGCRPHAGKRHLGFQHEVLNRRAQFMRQVGGKLLQARDPLFQAVQHGVESERQDGEVPRPARRRDAFVQVLRRDALGHAGDREQGAQAVTNDPRRGAGEQHKPHQGYNRQDATVMAQQHLVIADVQSDLQHPLLADLRCFGPGGEGQK